MKLKGILDRFEGAHAVILIEERMEEIVIPRDELPDGSEVNTHFNLEKRNDSYVIASIDLAATTTQAQKSSSLMEQLRAKKKDSKFKKKK
ncbi:DUF3006 domain-containing protein [Oceanobacillus bengalensis]|uniref:DUF3006 domain-containing protein n=1 Tax=Oceanobacillus bengalensis TaxID=1435466 RepID=A0A494YX44_9BACI|nr:DUF3006 domain-containing protein [Oceanobacillus bengalensis]RKQ14788.1 DUF3006 domain-containing protein [Oceanobacillus bengalensis]